MDAEEDIEVLLRPDLYGAVETSLNNEVLVVAEGGVVTRSLKLWDSTLKQSFITFTRLVIGRSEVLRHLYMDHIDGRIRCHQCIIRRECHLDGEGMESQRITRNMNTLMVARHRRHPSSQFNVALRRAR
jgi:hypothetical protein